MSFLNASQIAALAILPKISSPLSFFGSSAILAECFYFDRSRLQRVHHRILCLMAGVDLLESLWNFVGAWAVPKDSAEEFAKGNDMTCKAQGFFLQLSLASVTLNVFISWYYLLVIRYSWSEEKIKAKAEPWFYGVSLLLGFGTSIAGLALNLYHPDGRSWCYIVPPTDDPDTINLFKLYRWVFFWGPIFVCSLMIVVNTMLLIVTVRNIEKASMKYLSHFYEASALKKKRFENKKKQFWKTLRRGEEKNKNHDPENSRRMAELKRKLEEVKAKNTASTPTTDLQSRDTTSVLQLRAKKKNTKTKKPRDSNHNVLDNNGEPRRNEYHDLRDKQGGSDKFSVLDSRNRGTAFEEGREDSIKSLTIKSASIKRGEKTKRKKRSKTRIVSEQSFFYLLAFFLTFGWIIINSFLYFADKKVPYFLLVGQFFFDPLQGFLNFLVYIRPSFIAHRRHNPHLTRFQCCIALITHQETPGEDIETEAKIEIEEIKRASTIYEDSIRLKPNNVEAILRVPVNLGSAMMDEESVEEDETKLRGLVAPV